MAEKIQTFEDLQRAMAKFTEEHELDWEASDENVLWFVSYQRALMFREDSTKEQARQIHEGVPATTKEFVNDWLEQFYDEDIPEEDWPEWEADFEDFLMD